MPKLYTKETWIDESLAGPPRFDVKEDAGAAFKTSMQIEQVTPVTTAGTELTADRMNNIENGLDQLDTLIASMRDAAALLTIASGAITVTQSNHKLQPESGTADDLVTINGTTAGQSGFIYAEDYGTDTITIKHGTGNILCMGGADISLSHGCVSWFSIGTHILMSGGGAGGGGGSFTYPSSELTAPAPDDQIRIFKDMSAGSDVFITLSNLLKHGASQGSRATYTINTPSTVTLTDADPMLIALYGASPGDVVLPPPSSSNHVFILYGNAEGWWNVKTHAGTSLGYVNSLETRILVPINDGNYWTMLEAPPRAYAANDMMFGYSNGTYGTIWIRKSLTDSKTILGILATDTDGTLAANSDTKLATQKAVKTYVDNAVTGLLDFKGSTDASANPNYPSALKGDAYVVSAAGKIGGASGKSVDANDVYLAVADNAGGTEASVGTSWIVLEHNLAGALLSANNLSDLANPATARTNLGMSANGSSLVTAADYAAMRSLLGLVVNTNVQAHNPVLTTLAGASANGQSLITAANYAAMLALLFGVDLPENFALTMDDALSADGTYCAVEAEDGTAGEALSFGNLCIYNSSSKWVKSDADALATARGKAGFCILAAAGDNSATKILRRGKIRADAIFPTMTVGDQIFMSLTAGEVVGSSGLSSFATGDYIRAVGFANSADELDVDISPNIIKKV